jgi:hypothetical protein
LRSIVLQDMVRWSKFSIFGGLQKTVAAIKNLSGRPH